MGILRREDPERGRVVSPPLILIDGPPGAGKSTTAQWLAAQFQRNDRPARWLYELSASHPQNAAQPPAALLSTEDLFQRGLTAWARFAAQVRDAKEVTILDSGLFGGATVQAFRKGAPNHEIIDHLRLVEEILLPLRPLVIHLAPADVARHMAQTYRARGARYASRLAAWCGEHEDADQRGHASHGGDFRFWRDFGRTCDAFIGQMRLDGLSLRLTAEPPSRSAHQQILLSALRLSRKDVVQAVDPNCFVGTYVQPETGERFTIHSKDGVLFATGLLNILERESVLLPLNDHRLCVRGHDVELTFHDGDVRLHSSWRRADGVTYTSRARHAALISPVVRKA